MPTVTPPTRRRQTSRGRNPEGSDLWLDSFTEQDQLITDMQLPEGMSVLIAKDGTEPAPADIVVSWPLNTSTPWVGPLITAGGAVLLFGLVMYVLAIRHQRRGRGPRRKGPGALPATEPIGLSVEPGAAREELETKPADAKSTEPEQSDPEQTDPADSAPEKPEKPEKTERRALDRRRRLLALPALGVAGLLFAGCSSDSWPQFDEASPTPTPTETVIAPENQKPPAVTESQASRILQEVSATLQKADEEMDLDLAGTRLEGMALDARSTDYELRAAIDDRPLPVTDPDRADRGAAAAGHRCLAPHRSHAQQEQVR